MCHGPMEWKQRESKTKENSKEGCPYNRYRWFLLYVPSSDGPNNIEDMERSEEVLSVAFGSWSRGTLRFRICIMCFTRPRSSFQECTFPFPFRTVFCPRASYGPPRPRDTEGVGLKTLHLSNKVRLVYYFFSFYLFFDRREKEALY